MDCNGNGEAVNVADFFRAVNSADFRFSPVAGFTIGVWFVALVGAGLIAHTAEDQRSRLEAQTRATIAQTEEIRVWGVEQGRIVHSIHVDAAALAGDCREERDMNASVMRLLRTLHDGKLGVVATASTFAAVPAVAAPVATPSPVPSADVAATVVNALPKATPTPAPPMTQSYTLNVTLEGPYPSVIADLDKLRRMARPIATSSFSIIRSDQGQRAVGGGSDGIVDPRRVNLTIPLTVYFPAQDACQTPLLASSGVKP